MSAPPPPPSSDYTTATTTTATSARPWSEFLDISSLSLPVSLSDATSRLHLNLSHFRLNYAIVSLIILLLSLVFHPISLLLLLAVAFAWFFLFFSRLSASVPLEVFGFTIDDRVVLGGLSIITVLALVFANVWMNLVVSIVISVALVCLHGVFRVPSVGDDDPYGGLLDPTGDGAYSEF